VNVTQNTDSKGRIWSSSGSSIDCKEMPGLSISLNQSPQLKSTLPGISSFQTTKQPGPNKQNNKSLPDQFALYCSKQIHQNKLMIASLNEQNSILESMLQSMRLANDEVDTNILPPWKKDVSLNLSSLNLSNSHLHNLGIGRGFDDNSDDISNMSENNNTTRQLQPSHSCSIDAILNNDLDV
jgi:hypothetical protein